MLNHKERPRRERVRSHNPALAYTLRRVRNAEAIEMSRHEELEQALKVIQNQTRGAPVILKVLHS
jgi:hypothetical protein